LVHVVLSNVWCSVGSMAYAVQSGLLNKLLAGGNSAVPRGHTSNKDYTQDDAPDDEYEVKDDLDGKNGRGTLHGKTSRSQERKAAPGKHAKPSNRYEHLPGRSEARSIKSRGNLRNFQHFGSSSDEGSVVSVPASTSGADSVENGSGSDYNTTNGRKTTQTATKGASKPLKAGSDSRQTRSKARATSRQSRRRAGSVAEGLSMRKVQGTLMGRDSERKRYSTVSGRAKQSEEQSGLDVAVVEVQQQSDCGLVL
jgi:hypothetical protein